MDSHLPWDVWVCTWNMYALATIAVCSPSVVPRVLGASDGHTWLFHLWTRQVSSLSKLSRSYVASILAGSSPYYSGIHRINHTLSSVLVNLPPYFRGPLSINHPAKGRQLQIPSGLWEFQVSLSRESQRTIHPLTTAVIVCMRPSSADPGQGHVSLYTSLLQSHASSTFQLASAQPSCFPQLFLRATSCLGATVSLIKAPLLKTVPFLRPLGQLKLEQWILPQDGALTQLLSQGSCSHC